MTDPAHGARAAVADAGGTVDQGALALGASARLEWSDLVTAAVIGTDRRPPPPPRPGWDAPRTRSVQSDVAAELLDRAAVIATSRRAGITPAAAPLAIAPAPPDDRPVCSPVATGHLARILHGEHDVLLAEWMARCAAAGQRPPPHLVPSLLLRGRRSPAFDHAVRPLIGPLAAWIADAMPELGIHPQLRPRPTATSVDAFMPAPRPVDSAAVVAVICTAFAERSATWAAAGQLRAMAAGIDPRWLPALVRELERTPFHASTERARADLLALARVRLEIIEAFPDPCVPLPT